MEYKYFHNPLQNDDIPIENKKFGTFFVRGCLLMVVGTDKLLPGLETQPESTQKDVLWVLGNLLKNSENRI